MIVARSTEESVRLIASALGSLADTVAKLAGSLEEIQSRVVHIEEYLESIELVEDEEDRPSLLPCGFEGEGVELERWYSEPQEDD